MFCVLLSYLVARRCGVIVVDARFTAAGAQTKRKGGEPSCREANGGLLRPCVHVWLAVARGTWLCAWWESSGACDACVGVASPGGAGILSDGLWHYSRDASQSKSNSGEKEKQNVPCV